MPITIGSNIASLSAQRRLSDSTSQLSSTYERLSSGMRINKAADDAAGLAISESLKSDRRVFNQGIRNFNDGLSLLAIADGAIDNLGQIVTRLKELAEQSANGVYSQAQRSALDKEGQALSKEYTRIMQSTKFNGINLLDGSLGNGTRLQGGFGLDGGIAIDVEGAIGTGTFTAGNSFGSTAADVLAADFNGDGNIDIMSLNSTALAVNFAFGRGDGSFAAQTTIGIGTAASSAILGDFNGDGNVDFATQSGNQLNVFVGSGGGSFSLATSVSTVGAISGSLEVGDFNRDGIQDLAIAGYELVTLQGRGDGTFAAARSYSLGNFDAHSVAAGDYDGDGVTDLALAGYDNSTFLTAISIRLGTGSGTFTESMSISGSLDFVSPDIETGDFNGDGIMDLVSAGYNNANFSVYLGRGNGLFNSATNYAAGAGSGVVENVTLGDYNGDGVLDVAAAGSTIAGANVSIFLGNSRGQFERSQSLLKGNTVTGVAAGDFNGDGVTDLATAGNSAATVGTLLGSSKSGTSSLISFDLSTAVGARQALGLFENKIQQLGKQRGAIGAFQSRSQTAINVLQASAENYAAAEGRIRNADIAEESSQLVRLGILQQAASSVLAQANLQPQLALKLLES